MGRKVIHVRAPNPRNVNIYPPNFFIINKLNKNIN